jgi:two-component system, cell cycle sensor histidine kinase and response regulator CckA
MGLLNEQQKNRFVRRLRARQRHYRELLEMLPYGVVVYSKGVIRYANTAAARILGAVKSAQIIGHRYADLVMSAAPSSQQPIEQQTLRRFDGKIVEVEASSHAFMRGKQHMNQVVWRAVAQDPSPGVTAAERLRMVADAATATITLDPVGDVTQWCQAAEQMTGYSPSQIIGRSWSVLTAPEESERQILDEILRATIKNGRCQVEGWKRRRDGTMFYATQLYTALFNANGGLAGFALSLRDLSEQPTSSTTLRETEEQLRQAQRMEAVGRLASGIAHDFNNLLTAIQGHAQFLSEDLPAGHASRADAEEILHSADRAAALTRQLLAFSRGQSLQPETIQLNTVVTAMERLLRRVISEDIALESVVEPDLWAVRADPSQIEQVLVNLIVNARDAMPHGGRITIKTANAELATSYAQRREEVEPGEYVMLAVSDTGVGMDRDTQARIFEPFFTTKGPDRGTGLGLSTVFGIVKQMGGHIFVYSEADQGTTFKVYLPRAGAPQPAFIGDAQKRDRSRSGEAVLVVEDDDSVRGLARRVLESRGYRVWLASSPEEALDVMRDYGAEMSLLITDVVLPSMSGHDLVDRVRGHFPSMPVLFMSGYTQGDVLRQGSVTSEEHFLEKPFTPEAFAHTVREILDEKA